MTGLLDRLHQKSLRSRITNPVDEYWDRKLRIRTFGSHPGSGPNDGLNTNLPFVPSAYRDIFGYLRAVDIGPEDVFVDLGAGYGRTVFAASLMEARRAIGVDLVQKLVDGAEINRKRSALKGRDIEFVCANALNFTEPEMTILYMFHPFGETILEQVLKNLQASRAAAPDSKKLRIVYANPVYDDALARSGWLRKTAHVPGVKHSFSAIGCFDAAVWESV